jgi:hypothetical protein
MTDSTEPVTATDASPDTTTETETANANSETETAPANTDTTTTSTTDTATAPDTNASTTSTATATPTNDNVDKFESTSNSNHPPCILHVYFGDYDPSATLGAVLVNCDKENDAEMFLPGYAVIGRLLDMGIARSAGVQVGDIITAVSGEGVRRFAPDYNVHTAPVLNTSTNTTTSSSTNPVELDHKVIPPGTAYDYLIQKIKSIKLAGPDFPPLTLTLERYSWDARPHAWARFLAARENNVPEAMQMMQSHEAWKEMTFPISLRQRSLQHIMRTKAVSEIDVSDITIDHIPTVYVHYGKLQALQSSGHITADNVVDAFVIYTERLLAKAEDPRHPRTCQFIDMNGVSFAGLRPETLQKIYTVFEKNYPETLHKMVMYPISNMVVRTTNIYIYTHMYMHDGVKSCASMQCVRFISVCFYVLYFTAHNSHAVFFVSIVGIIAFFD